MKRCRNGHTYEHRKECPTCKQERKKRWEQANPEANQRKKQQYYEKGKES